MLTIYGAMRSRATRPIWLLYETNTPFQHVPVIQSYRLPDAEAPDAPFNTASPDFLKVNPQGLVPAMLDGDLLLTESLAITYYLARKFGGDLAPRDLAEEGQAVQWALLGATSVETPGLDIAQVHGKGLADTAEGQAIIADRTRALARPFARIEAHLQGRDWLMGDRFTVADIVLSECVRYAMAQPGIYDAWPALKAWLARCHARPAWVRMWAERNAEPV
ncbi:MAG: glutathione S-transferase family protein [Rhodobacterales bacterium]|nr:glutathione S-transferase family protein [Rhodobacterales bacterium]MDX5500589.1 glutathione S-transferase family protein [Rhodobacterales bacterium]